MDFIKKNMSVVLVVLLIVGGLVVYFEFFNKPKTAGLTSTADENSPVSQDLLVVLSNLKTINLDKAIFSDPAFVSLTNYGVEIPPEPIGRRNPFLPVGEN